MKHINIWAISIAVGIGLAVITTPSVTVYKKPVKPVECYDPLPEIKIEHKEIEKVKPAPVATTTKLVMRAKVTGYNTVPEQTDSTPCISASGVNICGRTDAVACPSKLPLGTEVRIDGRVYQCVDRLHSRFDNRFDISCDKDMECPYEVTGYKQVEILTML